MLTAMVSRWLVPLLVGMLASLAAFGCLLDWALAPWEYADLPMRVPGQDQLPPGGRVTAQQVPIGVSFQRFPASAPVDMTGVWPRFRGPDSSNISREGVPLRDAFGPEGPPVLWRVPLGEGHAAPVIYEGRVYLLDYLEDERADALRCFSLLTGAELWRRWYPIDIKRNHGRSRSVPAVDASYTVTIGPLGHVMCVDSQSGDLLWTRDMVASYQAVIPQWYTGQCPLLDEGIVILAPAGPETLLVGVRAATGEDVRRAKDPGAWTMSHASVMPMTFQGRKMYVYAALGGLAGVAAGDERTPAGEMLWRTDVWKPSVIAPSPVVLDDGLVYQSAGYGAGSLLLQLSGNAPPFQVQVLKQRRPKEGLATEQQSPIYYQGFLFGVMPKDAGTKRMMLVACRPTDPADFVFPGTPELRFGLGPYLVAADRFLALSDDGTLSILKFMENQFVKTAEHKVLPGVDAWGPLAIADGILLARDSTSMVALDLTAVGRWSGGEHP